MIYLKQCPKCLIGDVELYVQGNTTILKCLQCAYTVEGKQKVVA